MARKKVILPEEDLAPLRDQFLAWRSRRVGREPIPAHLWDGAVALAQAHGVCPVAKAFGLDYASLKAKATRAGGRSNLVKPAFLEIQASRSFPPGPGASIEITAPNGARMSIQLQAGQGQEAASIVAAFHWESLTLFLRVPGAVLDNNNIVERALKKVILHRKNALFYRTEHGAGVGDLFMSLIHTTNLNRVDPFAYLVALLEHPEKLAEAPADWMPWNYRKRLSGEQASA